MNGAFYIGATGLDAQQRALDVVANNIANINTSGFKRSAVRFSDMVAVAEPADASDPQALTQGNSPIGAAATKVSRIWSQGDLRQTGQQMDVAIDGDGFIEMLGPNGQAWLWRGGGLKVNADGYLAAADGTILHAMVSVPKGASALAIARDGTVTATVEGENAPVDVGQIQLVMVKDKDSLESVGGGYYRVADEASLATVMPEEEGAGAFVQGALESANVQLSDEMVTLLLLQRAYAANAQVVQAGDQLMSILNNLRR